MDPNLFVTMGRELRQLKVMHPDDGLLQFHADQMIMQMLTYETARTEEARANTERAFMANLAWLVEWKRKKLTVANPVL